MKTFTFLFLLCLVSITSSAQFKSSFKNFIILKLPENREVVGTTLIGSNYNGLPLNGQYVTTSNSLSNFFQQDSSQFKLEITNALESGLNFNSSKINITKLVGLEVSSCNDFTKLPLVKDNRIVIASVKVKSFEVNSKNASGVDLKAELSKYINNPAFKFDPNIKYENNKAMLTSGSDLVVAIQAIKIESTPGSYFFSSKKATVVNDNTFEIYEPDFKVRSQIAFMTCDDLTKYISTQEQLAKHQGCFIAAYINPIVTSSDGKLFGGQAFLCPAANKVAGDIKLTSQYRPMSDYTSALSKPLATVLSGKKLYNYTMQIRNLNSISYSMNPEAGVPGSNFVIDKVNAVWEVKKLVYDFEFVKK